MIQQQKNNKNKNNLISRKDRGADILKLHKGIRANKIKLGISMLTLLFISICGGCYINAKPVNAVVVNVKTTKEEADEATTEREVVKEKERGNYIMADRRYSLAALPVYAEKYVKQQGQVYALRGKNNRDTTVNSKSTGKVNLDEKPVLINAYYMDNGYLGQYKTSKGIINVLCSIDTKTKEIYVNDLYTYRGNKDRYTGKLPQQQQQQQQQSQEENNNNDIEKIVINKYKSLLNEDLYITDYKECRTTLDGEENTYGLLELKGVEDKSNNYVVFNLNNLRESHLL